MPRRAPPRAEADEICVAGGGEIYAESLPLADRLYMTHVAATPEGDTLFPEIPPDEWEEMSREALPEKRRRYGRSRPCRLSKTSLRPLRSFANPRLP